MKENSRLRKHHDWRSILSIGRGSKTYWSSNIIAKGSNKLSAAFTDKGCIRRDHCSSQYDPIPSSPISLALVFDDIGGGKIFLKVPEGGIEWWWWFWLGKGRVVEQVDVTFLVDLTTGLSSKLAVIFVFFLLVQLPSIEVCGDKDHDEECGSSWLLLHCTRLVEELM